MGLHYSNMLEDHHQQFVSERNDASVLEAQHAELKRKVSLGSFLCVAFDNLSR